MLARIILSIILTKFDIINTHFLEAEVNFQKPKLERNNIVNKRIWMKNKFKENSYEKATLGDFIFRENSLDVDNILQNNFDVFGEDRMQDSPTFSSYVKRAKRSNDVLQQQRLIKSMKNCKHKNCGKKKLRYNRDNADSVKSKIINNLKPASVFNDYPYEVAILLNNKREYNLIKSDNLKISDEVAATDLANNSLDFSKPDIQDLNNTYNISVPKRSMNYDFETEVVKKFEITEDINKTGDSVDSKNIRDVFEKDDQGWHQTIPVSDAYKVMPKEPQKSKPVTERGLIKVISMLTKTFKKIMRQHNEIKDIHVKIRDMSDDFNKNADAINLKFQEFDLKYISLMKFNEDLKNFELKLTAKEEYFKTKEREMANSLNEFENQQRKFLTQQRQFYNIQKLMLAQNEKINMKQSLIAKTQSEISHRQNNFARILKKAKQLYIDNKNLGTTKLNLSKDQKTDVKQGMNEDVKQESLTTTSTVTPQIESVKINLFSIPVSNKLENNDDLIIKEKDEQPIDDLVYKYYFNNTFIDNLMKNKILSGIVATSDSDNSRRNVKTKRNEINTILLPVNESNVSIILKGLNRNRRWINHHSRYKNRRKNRGKGDQITIINATDEKLIRNKPNSNHIPTDVVTPMRAKKDPFVTMAMNFCSELQANLDQQMMDWCVEKALRRLQYIDFAVFPSLASPVPPPVTPPPAPKVEKAGLSIPLPQDVPIDHTLNIAKETIETVKVNTVPTTVTPVMTEKPPTEMTSPSLMTTDTVYTLPTYTVQEATAVFFPDNDALESNLKQYELKPDTEGNIYYDGSIHASAFADSDSEFTDDFLPGIDSNSRVEVDPLAFDVQAKRRAYIRQLNERIKKQLG